jgi:5'-3' exonuclease
MTNYIIIDTQNLFMRIRFGVRAPDLDSQIGLALHIILTSIKKVWTDFDGGHCVFCLEGRSWRKDIYVPYKANRKVTASKRTVREVEEDTTFFEIMDEFVTFIRTKTNCTVLHHPNAEADDMIARWIQLHPDDRHVVISSDSDFQQLIAENTIIYNGIVGLLYTHNGIYDKDGLIAKNKSGQDMAIPDPQWILFEKCLRGDPGDNVMSAYPGVRVKKIQEAFNNRQDKGYAWNNIMLSKWMDHEGNEHRVKDDYERNRMLIDLTQQPADLIEKWSIEIINSVQKPMIKQVGIALMRFCNQHGLIKIEKNTGEYSPCLSASYQGYLLDVIDDLN